MNLTETREKAVEIVKEAGQILKDHFELRDTTDRSKGGVDFVTEADEEVDNFLIERLKREFPSTNFLTEETAQEQDALDNYSRFVRLNDLWVIDPLDGTTLFSRGNSDFGISVGLADQGIPKLGIIYFPVGDRLLWAQQDQDGAFLNGNSIHVSSVSELRKAVITTDWPHDLTKRTVTVDWQRDLSPYIRSIRILGSAVSALSAVAFGETDAFIHPGVKPWDIAAGSLIITKAGGIVTTVTGRKWDIFSPDIFASNGQLDQVLQLISTNLNS